MAGMQDRPPPIAPVNGQGVFLKYAFFLLSLLFASGSNAYPPGRRHCSPGLHVQPERGSYRRPPSPCSHMGIVPPGAAPRTPLKPSKWVVSPVRPMAGARQIRPYVVKRPRMSLDSATLMRLHDTATAYLGKPYDLAFEWSNPHTY